jgi:hypothetical protein
MYAATGNTAPAPWGYRHSRLCAGVRIAAGTWNLVLGCLLISHGHAWGSILFVTAALIFAAAYGFARRNSQYRRNGRG